MAILIGVWESILVLAIFVFLTTLAVWWYWRRRLADLEQAYARKHETELADLQQACGRKHQAEIRKMTEIFKHQTGKPLRLINDNLHQIKSGMQRQSAAEVGEWPQLLGDSLRLIEEYEWRLNRLIENMIFVSDLEAPDSVLSFSEVKLDVIVSDVVSEFRDATEAKGIRLAWWARPERFPRITANEVNLRQVFINLIDNAVKYCGEKDEIDVALEANEAKNVIYARVSDTGPGIPEEDWERIFHKGYTVEGARGRKPKEGSQGLGLYIAELVIEKHKGKIDVTGELGKGTTFTITLPIQRI